MAVTSTTFSSPNTTVSSSSLGGAGGLDLGEKSLMGSDAFMKLLIAQLKNQDPNQPADTKEMVTQLSQLTSVQELTNMRSQLSNLTIATAGLSNIQTSSLVGKSVNANGSMVRLNELGEANVGFSITGGLVAKEVKIKIMDAEGNVVRSDTMTNVFPGERNYTWSGADDAGRRAQPGRYRVEITAFDDNGLPVASSTDVRGLVSEVSFENGYPELVIGTRRVMMGDIQSIEN